MAPKRPAAKCPSCMPIALHGYMGTVPRWYGPNSPRSFTSCLHFTYMYTRTHTYVHIYISTCRYVSDTVRGQLPLPFSLCSILKTWSNSTRQYLHGKVKPKGASHHYAAPCWAMLRCAVVSCSFKLNTRPWRGAVPDPIHLVTLC